jgi:hypothetical protein
VRLPSHDHSYSNRDLLGVRHRRWGQKVQKKRILSLITARRRSQQRLGGIIAEVALTSDGRRATTLRDFGRRLVSIRRAREVQPLIGKAKPDKPVRLGPSEAGQLATTVGLQAQLVAHRDVWQRFIIRRHADRDYTPTSLGWCRAIYTRVCPRNKLSQGLTGAVVPEI